MNFRLAQLGTAISFVLLLAQAHPAHAAPTGNAAAAAVFRQNCSTCHGDNGAGSAVGKSLHTPDLRSATVQKQTDAELVRFISEGSGAMPPFKQRLNPSQILEEVRYVRSLSRTGAAHP